MKKQKKVGSKPPQRFIIGFIAKHRLKIAVLLTPLLIFLYLNTANNHFYHRLHTAGLPWPQNQDLYEFNTASSSRTLKYIALGDSLTTGVGAESFNQTYSYLVAEKIASHTGPVTLLPLATPGYKSVDVVNKYLNRAVSEQPDIVTILIGVNDVHGLVPSSHEFRRNYSTIIERLRFETNAKIYVVAIPYIGTDNLVWPPYKNYYSFRTYAFNTIIRDLTAVYGVNYIDLYAATIHYAASISPYYSKDEFHPSSSGYSLWAEVIARGISL